MTDDCCRFELTCNSELVRLFKENRRLRQRYPQKARRLPECIPCCYTGESYRFTVSGVSATKEPLGLIKYVSGKPGTRKDLCCCLRYQNRILRDPECPDLTPGIYQWQGDNGDQLTTAIIRADGDGNDSDGNGCSYCVPVYRNDFYTDGSSAPASLKMTVGRDGVITIDGSFTGSKSPGRVGHVLSDDSYRDGDCTFRLRTEKPEGTTEDPRDTRALTPLGDCWDPPDATIALPNDDGTPLTFTTASGSEEFVLRGAPVTISTTSTDYTWIGYSRQSEEVFLLPDLLQTDRGGLCRFNCECVYSYAVLVGGVLDGPALVAQQD